MLTSVCCLRGVRAARRERDRDVVPRLLRRFLDGGASAEDDQVGQRDLLLAAGLVEVLLDLLEGLQHLGQPGRLVRLPALLRLEADARSVGAAPLVGAAEAGRRSPGRGDELRDGQARVEDLALEGGDVLLTDQLVIDGRDGVLPQLRLGDPRAEVARARAHVAVEQLEPGPGEGVGELVRVLVEALRDRRVDRIHLQRQVRGQHHRRVPLATGRARRARCPGPRGSSASTASRRRGSSSAPTRT